MPLAETMKLMKTSIEKSVFELSQERIVFLVFLRHFGCVFCRESLMELSDRLDKFKENDIIPIFVHMTDYKNAEFYFNKYNLKNAIHVSDPDCKFYLSFGLVKGRFNQLFGLRTAIRGFQVTLGKGIFPTLTQVGDGLQMPGIFIIKNGNVQYSFIHKFAADKPDYDELISKCKFD